jgi:hypothetical protein
MPGIFISRGMQLTIPSFSLRFGDGGEIEADPITLLVRFDVCPTWIQIAKRHLDEAQLAMAQRDKAWRGSDGNIKGRTLEVEFEASMLAIMSAAISWDAFYAILREHVIIPPGMAEKWRRGRTARYIQVAETVRRAFSLRSKGSAVLRSNLKALYSARDMAVHPSGKIGIPILHPELDVGMEWRFVYFRARNAETVVLGAARMLWDLAKNGQSKDSKITAYQQTLLARLQEVFPDGVQNQPAPADVVGDGVDGSGDRRHGGAGSAG